MNTDFPCFVYLNIVKKYFFLNNYPITFIQKHINKIISFLNNRKINSNNEKSSAERNNTISIPFYNHISENIKRLLNKTQKINIVFKVNSKFNKSIKIGKETLDLIDINNVPAKRWALNVIKMSKFGKKRNLE